MTVQEFRLLSSVRQDTFKAALTLDDGARIETVLMKNARGQWTVCVSSQVGCAMACTFCATGTMGFTRNLSEDEIVDQYRYWNMFLRKRTELPQRISNIVFMGMGEPLSNVEAVKGALHMLLKYTDLGPTHITVSTVGLIPMLRQLLTDAEWPPVRLAVSLHSAVPETRRRLMPTSYETFLDDLVVWADAYFEGNESRRRHLTFEYLMLSRVNDDERHAEALIRFARRVGKVRINLIPYNYSPQNPQRIAGQAGTVYRESLPGDFARFEEQLNGAGITVTRRRTMGDDIAAACGQLVLH